MCLLHLAQKLKKVFFRRVGVMDMVFGLATWLGNGRDGGGDPGLYIPSYRSYEYSSSSSSSSSPRFS
jgi:hypothetical protein